MRYFDENTKEEIIEPDFDLGNVSGTDTNEIISSWVIDKPATHKTIVDAENPETGGKITHEEIETPEEGHWNHETASVYGVPEDYPDPEGSPHDLPIPGYETVSLWHVYTAEELAEIERKKQEQEQEQEFYKNYDSSTDECNCVIYESLKNTNAFTDTEPFCYAYARRIKKEEITIEQCPEELQERIKELAYPNGNCSIVKTATNCKLLELKDSYKRGETINFEILPADNCRLPYDEEFAENIIVSAEDDKGAEIPDYLATYCTYEVVDRSAFVTAAIPSNCAKITVNITCIEE